MTSFQTDSVVLDNINPTEPTFSSLSNGQTINHKWYLKGGGNFHYPYFLQAIQAGGKSKYNRCFEWCCGHGIIGWEILTRGICEQLSFSDCYDLAVDTCLANAIHLGYQPVVEGYVASTILSIPQTEKWDLVVGNPPNSGNAEGFIDQATHHNDQPTAMQNMALRITVDQGWVAHREFFENIRSRITDDADIFLTMHDTVLDQMRPIHESANFRLVSVTDMFPVDTNLKVVHFKSN
jgi:methylase of polypeptide subunit release factors